MKHEKLPPSYNQDAKNFSVVKPLNSEARASPASPAPRPLYTCLTYVCMHGFFFLMLTIIIIHYLPKCFSGLLIFLVEGNFFQVMLSWIFGQILFVIIPFYRYIPTLVIQVRNSKNYLV